jgi:large repetitive protein
VLDTHEVSWDFGDGTVLGYRTATGDTLHPSHAYAATGTFTVTMRVRDDDGGVGVFQFRVNVGAVGLQGDPCDPSAGTALVVGGTDGDDVIRFTPQGNQGDVKVTINGVSYGVFRPTSRIIAYGLGGDDDIGASGSIAVPTWLYGNAGDDRLNAGNAGGVLVGGDGDDELLGGSARDILIGGRGSDRLVGNGGDDVLIAGATAYDDGGCALTAVYRYWVRSDRTLAQRVTDLSSGNYAGGFVLNPATAFNDVGLDVLTGSSGDDWFFADAGPNSRDRVTDQHPSEPLTKLVR